MLFSRFAKTLWMTSSTRADASIALVNDELRIASLDSSLPDAKTP